MSNEVVYHARTPAENTEGCFVPRGKDIKNIEDFERVISSHDWKLVSSNEYGSAVLVTSVCKRCETERVVTCYTVLRK